MLHPQYNHYITVKDYRNYISQLEYQTEEHAPAGRCPICKGSMKPRGGRNEANEHFMHSSHNTNCPSIQVSANPYRNLYQGHVDPIVVQQNRDFLINNMNSIYDKLCEIVPFLDFKEFLKILEESKRLNIFAYVNLVSEHLPYVMVVLINFLPSKSQNKQRNL